MICETETENAHIAFICSLTLFPSLWQYLVLMLLKSEFIPNHHWASQMTEILSALTMQTSCDHVETPGNIDFDKRWHQHCGNRGGREKCISQNKKKKNTSLNPQTQGYIQKLPEQQRGGGGGGEEGYNEYLQEKAWWSRSSDQESSSRGPSQRSLL